MEIKEADYELPGAFYLGREVGMESGKADGDLVLYDSKDLVTHGVVLGMTGSGKTGLCLTLLEEAMIDRVPAIVIDPKGDISDLLLTFPDMKAEDFRPWINEDDAAKKSLDPDAYAAKTAQTWEEGLAAWGQSKERITRLRAAADVRVFTPGSRAGIPVSILSSLQAPPFEVVDDGELFGERIESTVSSLLSLIGVDADPVQSHEAVLLANVFSHAWQAGENLTLESLIRQVQQPPFDKVGVIDLDSFLSVKERQSLALKFNNLLASPGFSGWLEGPPLEIGSMLYGQGGKPRVAIFSIAHLSDAERMFFTSLLLNQMVAWMRAQKGTTSLRALLYMDEIFGYLPPSANPPSKKPMMTLLKQGRAFGVGCLLATQNPVDLDYKALSNIGTWWLGRLQTERDKARVLDGLEGASGDHVFDRAKIEKLLSALGNRRFLMNNVHEDAPVLFETRWVMSYLPGPLTRTQIKTLMDPVRDEFVGSSATAKATAANPMSMPGAAKVSGGSRPIVGPGVTERFVTGVREAYQPALLRQAVVHFVATKLGVEGSTTVCFVNPITAEGIDWDHPVELEGGVESLVNKPDEDVGFADLPGFAMKADSYKVAAKEFADQLYREQKAEVFSCPALKEFAKFGESEAEFRGRLALKAREVRDAAVQKLRDDLGKKLKSLESKLQTAQGTLERQKAEASSAKMQTGISILGGILGAVMGRKGGLGSIARSGSSAFNKASGAYKQSQDVDIAEGKVGSIQSEIDALNQQAEAEIARLQEAYQPEALVLDTETVKPRKADIDVKLVGLVWVG